MIYKYNIKMNKYKNSFDLHLTCIIFDKKRKFFSQKKETKKCCNP